MPIQTGLTGRRIKAAIRGVFAVEEHTKKEDSAEDHPVSSSSHDSQNKITRNKSWDARTRRWRSEERRVGKECVP